MRVRSTSFERIRRDGPIPSHVLGARNCGRYNSTMPGNSFGELFRMTTAGVSHGPGYLCIIDGCPPGLPLSVDDLLPDLRRRRPGQSKIVTQRQEEDIPDMW